MSGYSGTPLARKLGIKEGADRGTRQPGGPPHAARSAPAGRPLEADPRGPRSTWPSCSSPAGTTWRGGGPRSPRRSGRGAGVGGVAQALERGGHGPDQAFRADLLPSGWVDVKVCAIDETWSGLESRPCKELRPLGPPGRARRGPRRPGRPQRRCAPPTRSSLARFSSQIGIAACLRPPPGRVGGWAGRGRRPRRWRRRRPRRRAPWPPRARVRAAGRRRSAPGPAAGSRPATPARPGGAPAGHDGGRVDRSADVAGVVKHHRRRPATVASGDEVDGGPARRPAPTPAPAGPGAAGTAGTSTSPGPDRRGGGPRRAAPVARRPVRP